MECDKQVSSKLGSQLDVLLVEYQATQSSAQHHDTVSWSVNAVIWGANLILLGFSIGSIQNGNAHKLFMLILALLGIAMTFSAWRIWNVLRDVVKEKYAHCRQIEEQVGMRQHINTARDYPKGMARRLFALISLLFTSTWLLVFWLSIKLAN